MVTVGNGNTRSAKRGQCVVTRRWGENGSSLKISHPAQAEYSRRSQSLESPFKREMLIECRGRSALHVG